MAGELITKELKRPDFVWVYENLVGSQRMIYIIDRGRSIGLISCQDREVYGVVRDTENLKTIVGYTVKGGIEAKFVLRENISDFLNQINQSNILCMFKVNNFLEYVRQINKK